MSTALAQGAAPHPIPERQKGVPKMENQAFTTEIFNVTQEIDHIEIAFDSDGEAMINESGRRC